MNVASARAVLASNHPRVADTAPSVPTTKISSTARAAASGLSVCLVEPTEQRAYRKLCHDLGEAEGLAELELDMRQLARHREVAPNQYEFAPLFGTATTQIDQNLVVMQASDAAQTMNLNLTLSRRWRRRDASTPSMRPRESLRVS